MAKRDTAQDADIWQWLTKLVAEDPVAKLTDCDNVLQIDPRSVKAWINRGAALNALDRPAEALTSFDNAIQIDTLSALAWSKRVLSLVALRRYEEALTSLDRAGEIDPQFATEWPSRGFILNLLGRFDEALECYDKYVAMKPQCGPAWQARGDQLATLDRHEEALVCYDKTLELQPRSAYAWTNRSAALEALGRYKEALTSSDMALEINPRWADAWGSRGVVFANLGRYEEALASYDKFLEIDAQSPDIWSNRGNVLVQLGRVEEGLASIDRALELNPRSTHAWVNRGVFLLAQPPGFPERAAGQRSLQRAAWLLSSGVEVRLQYLARPLIDTLDRDCDAPLLVRGLVERLGIASLRLGDESRLRALERNTQLPMALVDWLDDPSTPLDRTDRLRLAGQVYLAFGDPVRALETLRELTSSPAIGSVDRLFLAWAMMECLEPIDMLVAPCGAEAERLLTATNVSPLDAYYAGHLFMLTDQVDRAGEAFRQSGNWPPAMAMCWLCADRQGNAEVARAVIEALFEAELRWFQTGFPRSLFFPGAMRPVDPRTAQGREDLQWVIHGFEISEAVNHLLLRLDDLAECSKAGTALLSKVDRSGRDSLALFEHRRQAWCAVDDFIGDVRAHRRAVAQQKVERFRTSLHVEYEQLGLPGREGLGVDELSSYLAERLYQTDLAAISDRIGQAIVLLHMERRLPLKPCALLAIYALAKRQHDLKHQKSYRKLALKAGIAGALATPLQLLGFDAVVQGFASFVGVGLTELVADYILAGHALGADDPSKAMPTFERFVEELQDYWACKARPEALRILLS